MQRVALNFIKMFDFLDKALSRWSADTTERHLLEFDLVIPQVGESSEKLGYLHNNNNVTCLMPGDVVRIYEPKALARTNPLLEMVYDEYFTLNTIYNRSDLKLLPSGTELIKVCSTLKTK